MISRSSKKPPPAPAMTPSSKREMLRVRSSIVCNGGYFLKLYFSRQQRLHASTKQLLQRQTPPPSLHEIVPDHLSRQFLPCRPWLPMCDAIQASQLYPVVVFHMYMYMTVPRVVHIHNYTCTLHNIVDITSPQPLYIALVMYIVITMYMYIHIHSSNVKLLYTF